MPAYLTRTVRIYLSRTGLFAYAENGSQAETELLLSDKGYRLCASVDSNFQGWHMLEKFCENPANGVYFVTGLSTTSTDEERARIGQKIENEYQRMKGV